MYDNSCLNPEYKRPVFINNKGIEWYIDETLTDAANKENDGLPSLNAKCFILVKDNNPITRILIDSNQRELCEDSSFESMASKIDWLRLNK